MSAKSVDIHGKNYSRGLFMLAVLVATFAGNQLIFTEKIIVAAYLC